MTTLTPEAAEAAIRAAREAHASLIDKRSQHEKRLADISRERAALAFDAHRGDPKSRQRLDKIHLEAAKADSEFLSIDAAISEAQSRVRLAEADLVTARSEADAERALSLLDPLLTTGSLIDEAIGQLVQGLGKLRSQVRELRALGAHPASEQSMRVAIVRSLESALADEIDVPLHRPSERRSFADLSGIWVENCRTVLRRPTPEEAA